MLVRDRRRLAPERLDEVATARVFTAGQALAAGLTDRTGYLEDAFAEARALAGLPDDARLVVYRRDSRPDETPYDVSSAAEGGVPDLKLVDLGLAEFLVSPRVGFYWLWAPELER